MKENKKSKTADFPQIIGEMVLFSCKKDIEMLQ